MVLCLSLCKEVFGLPGNYQFGLYFLKWVKPHKREKNHVMIPHIKRDTWKQWLFTWYVPNHDNGLHTISTDFTPGTMLCVLHTNTHFTSCLKQSSGLTLLSPPYGWSNRDPEKLTLSNLPKIMQLVSRGALVQAQTFSALGSLCWSPRLHHLHCWWEKTNPWLQEASRAMHGTTGRKVWKQLSRSFALCLHRNHFIEEKSRS